MMQQAQAQPEHVSLEAFDQRLDGQRVAFQAPGHQQGFVRHVRHQPQWGVN